MNQFNWKTATDAEVDIEYSPSRFAMRPLDDYLHEYAQLSAPFRGLETATPHTPLLIYIHGGYWQRLSAADSLFNAQNAGECGVSLHAVEYTLAPTASVEEIVRECIADVVATIEKLHPTKVVIAGCSAGAHLAAMCVRDQRIQKSVDGVALLSGIYDVRPIVRTPTNEPLQLTEELACAVSPQLLSAVTPPPRALLAVGQHESSEFIRQNREFGELLQTQGSEVSISVVPNRDHFNLPYDLLRKGTIVGDWVLQVLKGSNS